MTLGIGLLIDVGIEANWVKLAIYQIIGGVGFGMNLEGPLLAVQTVVDVKEVATATASMSFIRSISTAISIVIGGVVFQNEMSSKRGMLEDGLGTELAKMLSGDSATANVNILEDLPAVQNAVAKQAYFESTRSMWIMVSSTPSHGVRPTVLTKHSTQPSQVYLWYSLS